VGGIFLHVKRKPSAILLLPFTYISGRFKIFFQTQQTNFLFSGFKLFGRSNISFHGPKDPISFPPDLQNCGIVTWCTKSGQLLYNFTELFNSSEADTYSSDYENPCLSRKIKFNRQTGKAKYV
jgi:hypothetical protein